MEDILQSQFGKMFMELLAAIREQTSESCLKPCGISQNQIAFLDCRCRGHTQ